MLESFDEKLLFSHQQSLNNFSRTQRSEIQKANSMIFYFTKNNENKSPTLPFHFRLGYLDDLVYSRGNSPFRVCAESSFVISSDLEWAETRPMKNHLSPPYNSAATTNALEDVEMLCFIINSKNDSIYWKNTKNGVACNMVIKSQALNYIQFAMMTMIMVKLLENYWSSTLDFFRNWTKTSCTIRNVLIFLCCKTIWRGFFRGKNPMKCSILEGLLVPLKLMATRQIVRL